MRRQIIKLIFYLFQDLKDFARDQGAMATYAVGYYASDERIRIAKLSVCINRMFAESMVPALALSHFPRSTR
jgi:hypothetical protein